MSAAGLRGALAIHFLSEGSLSRFLVPGIIACLALRTGSLLTYLMSLASGTPQAKSLS